jgi:hypothetical protein
VQGSELKLKGTAMTNHQILVELGKQNPLILVPEGLTMPDAFYANVGKAYILDYLGRLERYEWQQTVEGAIPVGKAYTRSVLHKIVNDTVGDVRDRDAFVMLAKANPPAAELLPELLSEEYLYEAGTLHALNMLQPHDILQEFAQTLADGLSSRNR